MDHWIQAALIAFTSVFAAVVALIAISFNTGQRLRPALKASSVPEVEQTVFLFDDQDLVDATVPARKLLEAVPLTGSDWARLAAFLGPRLDDFPGRMAALSAEGRIEMTGRSEDGDRAPIRLIAEDVAGLARLTLVDPSAEGRGVLVDGLSMRAIEDELDLLRDTLDHAPTLVWREDASGTVSWANRAYILQSGALDHAEETLIWPLPKIFPLAQEGAPGAPRRARVDGGSEEGRWFDCYAYPYAKGTLHFALSADSAARAEKTLRDFVQTLTKTFADLPIGLAVFDRQRQLQLFNPALLDLTQLGPEFLSARPTLYAFLDRLREARMVPEPKDYRSWRLQMTELEKASAAGFHTETWSLPSGQTYRVTGRPHPNGAVAFLFEDISSEIALTRRFRAELELSHRVFDLLPDGVAVFQASGELAMSNTAFARIWGVEPDSSLRRFTFADATRIWQDQCRPDPTWAKMRDFANRIGAATAISGRVEMRTVQSLGYEMSGLPGGAVMVRFWPLQPESMAPELTLEHAQTRPGLPAE